LHNNFIREAEEVHGKLWFNFLISLSIGKRPSFLGHRGDYEKDTFPISR